jgi:hypothetical protein
MKPGTSYNQLKAQEAGETGSIEATNLIEQVGAGSQYKPQPQLGSGVGSPPLSPEKIQSVKQKIAAIRSAIFKDSK